MQLNLKRWTARWKIPADRDLARVRAWQDTVLDRELSAALARIPEDKSILCIKRLYVPLRLRSGQTDFSASWQLSEAIAREVERAVSGEAGYEVLRFRHTAEALWAFACAAASGDGRHDWAWVQLGWLPAGSAAISSGERRGAWLQALANAAWTALATLRPLAETGHLAILAAEEGDSFADAIACTVAVALGLEPCFTAANDTPVAGDDHARTVVLVRGISADAAASAVYRLAIPASERTRRAWLFLASALAVPARLQTETSATLTLLERHLQSVGDPPQAPFPVTPVRPRVASPRPPGTRLDSPAGDSVTVGDRAPQAPGPLTEGVDEAQPTPQAVTGETDYGGLLFLLPLVESSGALETLSGGLSEWPVETALYRLALAILPLPHRDPAVLAFCGRFPDREPPADARLPLAPSAIPVLRTARQQVLRDLADRLPHWPKPALATRVVHRRSVVIASPGWFDVRFRLADVSVDIRRAGLDLDPGFIPWLGIVLRFLYA